jgi:hypothetical protein
MDVLRPEPRMTLPVVGTWSVPCPQAGNDVSWRWHLLAACLILAVTGLRLVYLACACPLDLAPDEAHYWDWSRHLDWSYYSKGPLVAWLIRGSCLLSGPWSRTLTGTDMLAVRLPAVLCGGLLLTSVYILTIQVFRRGSLALAVVAVALTVPMTAAGAALMTIDAPYTCCWGWALVLGHHAVFRRSAWSWPAAGFAVGLGILAKYTMVLWLPSVAFFLLGSRAHRRLLLSPAFWIMIATAAVCCVPILVWNVQQNWVTLRHVLGQAGMSSGPALHWEGPLIFLGTQCALLLGFWFVAWVAAMVAFRPGVQADEGIRYLWWLSAPMFLVFLLFSVKTRGGEPNWPVTAYISGLVLTAGWLAGRMQSAAGLTRRLTGIGIAAACLFGLIVTLLIHRTDYVYPLLARLTGPGTANNPLPLRRLDPTCRLRGWRTLAATVDVVRGRLQDEGIDPVLAGTGWNLPGEVAFYCAGQPPVYSVGLSLGDRHSQYDLWRPNPLADGPHFAGRTFIVIGGFSPQFGQAFAKVEPPQQVVHYEAHYPVALWAVTVCRGFHGFPEPMRPPGRF